MAALRGIDGDDVLNSTSGDDVIEARLGGDFVNSGDGDDIITDTGGPVNVIDAGAGNDLLTIGHGNYSYSYRGETTITLGTGIDTIVLGHNDGRHVETGGNFHPEASPNNSFYENSSTLIVTDFTASVGGEIIDLGAFLIGRDALRLVGATASDLLAENFAGYSPDRSALASTQLTGTSGADFLRPTIGSTTVMGLDGNDVISGNVGNEAIDGGAGNDVMFGEAGEDVFVFNHGTGGDVIGDFTSGEDQIDIQHFGLTSFEQLQAAFIQNGNVGAINLGNGDFIVLHNVQMGQLTATDFIL